MSVLILWEIPMNKVNLLKYIYNSRYLYGNKYVFSGPMLDRIGIRDSLTITGLRELRRLREAGLIEYTVLSKNKSLYRISTNQNAIKKLVKFLEGRKRGAFTTKIVEQAKEQKNGVRLRS